MDDGQPNRPSILEWMFGPDAARVAAAPYRPPPREVIDVSDDTDSDVVEIAQPPKPPKQALPGSSRQTTAHNPDSARGNSTLPLRLTASHTPGQIPVAEQEPKSRVSSLDPDSDRDALQERENRTRREMRWLSEQLEASEREQERLASIERVKREVIDDRAREDSVGETSSGSSDCEMSTKANHDMHLDNTRSKAPRAGRKSYDHRRQRPDGRVFFTRLGCMKRQ